MQPCNHGNAMAIIISGIDIEGFDLAWKLLPRRTGMMIPEWSMLFSRKYINLFLY